MKTIFYSFILVLFTTCGIISCNKDEAKKSTEKQITEFVINSVKADINEPSRTIQVALPCGTDVSLLAPTIKVSEKASVQPESEESINFTNPIEYTVTAEDGTNIKYTVNVTVNQCSGKDILGFSINSEQAEIDHTALTITLNLPIGTDLTKLEPQINISEGASISPKSGEKTDFTNPVEYTITAEDGTSIKYTVIVTKNKSSNKKITSFIFGSAINELKSAIVGSINENAKTITIETQQWIANPASLIATFEAQGIVSVNNTNQENNTTPNNFFNDVIYTVTAEDGSTVEYTASLLSPQTSGLPVIKIDIDGGKEITQKKDEYDNAKFQLIDRNNPSNSFSKETGIRGRGNSTWTYPKKPYRIKFDKKQSIFGLGAEKSWVLLANYLDPTVMMNDVAFELARRLGLEYTNHSHHVELFMNGTYRGNYQLTEQIQVNKNRVNINEKTGFLVELDIYYDEDWKFKTNKIKLPVMVKSPDIENASEMDFIIKAMQDLEDAMFSNQFPNNNYQDLVDINSLIDYMLVNEITRNAELYHPKSTYAYKKDENSKIFWGPVWDFDWGFGYTGGGHTYFSYTDILFYPGKNNNYIGSKFFNRFFDDPDFTQKYKQRWNELKTTQIETIVQYVDELSNKLQKSQKHNYKRWTNYSSHNFTSEANKMRNWLTNRIKFLDTQINNF